MDIVSIGQAVAQALKKGDARYPQISSVGRDSLESVNGIALMPWHTALGNAANSPAKWMQLGDSLTEGYAATSIANRWAALAADQITSRWPRAGAFATRGGNYKPCFWWGQISGSTVLPNPTTLVGSGQTADSGWGFGGRAGNCGDQAGYSWTETCDDFDVCYVNYPGGTLGVTVDGGTEITFSTFTSGQAQPLGGLRWNAKTNGGLTLTASSHTIRVRCIGATRALISGLMLYLGNKNAGVQVIEAGHYGWTTSDWTTSNGNNQYRLHDIKTLQPHLTTIMLGANDYKNGVAPATFQANLQTLITQLRSVATAKQSIMLLACHPRGDVTSPAYPWASYIAAMQTIAATDTGGIAGTSGVGFADLSRRLPAPGSNGAGDPLGLIYSDRVHYTDLAGGLIANAVVSAISPR